MNPRVLVVSPHFCPVNTPDMQRVRMSLPRFVERGWGVTVLTVDDPTPTAPLDEELARTVPTAVEVVRAYCFPRGLTRLVGIGNVALRALPFIFATGCRLLAARRYDVVYFSTTMFGVLPLGRIWHALYGVPYVVDLQDPWFTDFYERPGAPPPPGGWKYRFARAQARMLEGWSMCRATHVISVSDHYLSALEHRYPWFKSIPRTVLPFGAPTRDLRLAGKGSGSGMTDSIVYVGRLGGIMLPALEIFLQGLARARRDGTSLTAHFLGTAYAPPPHDTATTPALAARHGLRDNIQERTARMGYLDSLRAMRGAGINLVLGTTDAGYMPSKLLACLASGRPVLVIAFAGSALERQCRSWNLPGLVRVSSGGEEEAVRRVAEFVVRPRPFAPDNLLTDDGGADVQLGVLTAASGQK